MTRGIGILLTIAILVTPACSAETEAESRVRESVNTGKYGWFPGDRAELKKTVEKHLADAGEVKVDGKPIAIIAPHAGYRYSGATAGYAFKPIVGKRYKRVIVIAPSHHAAFSGGSIGNFTHYGTPLGRIPVDTEACEALLKYDCIQSHPTAHAREHSLQSELPFLQVALKDWKLVPIVVGAGRDKKALATLAAAIKTVVTGDTLIVVSSDFTHYGGRFGYMPFTTDLKNNIRKLDQGAIDRICANDFEGFSKYLDLRQPTICGRLPIVVLLKMLAGRKDVKGKLVKYATSGDMTGDFRSSVSYAAIVMTQTGKPAEASPEKLTEAEQQLLLKIARLQVEKAVRGRKKLRETDYNWKLTKMLKANGGVFVTLKNKERLRGCIGHIIPREPLYRSVMSNAWNSAVEDRRFARNPITAKELPSIDIEISYLTPMKTVKSYKDIVIGKHGILLTKGYRRSVYLPQVAVEQKWDLDTTLQHLSQKAGLSSNAYKTGCTFQVFEAQVFGEKEYDKK